MGYQSVEFSLDGHIGVLNIARPDAANAMDLPFWQEMVDVFTTIADDPEVRVVVLTGRGKHFTAGIDLSALGGIINESRDDDWARQRDRLRRTILELQETFSVIERCRVPVLAAIQGACIGGGIDLISACDMRYCTEDAFFCIHETNIGMVADVGTLQRLPKIIPDGVMRELSYTGRRMGAAEAKDCGLVNATYPNVDALYEGVWATAREIATKSPLAVTGCKEMISYARDHSESDGLNYIATWNAAFLSGPEMKRALDAQSSNTDAVFDALEPAPRQVRNRGA
ncbi:MAG: crotonase/enoyl-CoA hydratase family protein [Pseudomonadota bacterium]